jgi:hypothetical protein
MAEEYFAALAYLTDAGNVTSGSGDQITSRATIEIVSHRAFLPDRGTQRSGHVAGHIRGRFMTFVQPDVGISLASRSAPIR